jgi:hypothetical protein
VPRDVGCLGGAPGIVADAEHEEGRTDLSGRLRDRHLGPRGLAQHARRRARSAQDDPLRRGDRP